ncbi:hypothetical protein T05_15162 [Trichinella murrelli]|uniref:Uncharacterized protein n=1 Tax=Trichinella murrelli TaxID=144512 RepID=A0A0V0TS34_9BILA|nr:hypothetical protein T05_15162 [Trichinella murrelli]
MFEVENKSYVNRQNQIKTHQCRSYFNIAVVDIFVGNLKIGNLICWLEFANCKNVPHFLNEDDDV